MRRRVEWVARVFRLLPPILGNALAILTAVVSVLLVIGLAAIGSWLAAAAVTVAVLILVLAEAAYREWNRWAPYDPPNVSFRLDARLWKVALIVRNADAPAEYSADVMAVTLAGAQAPGSPFPLAWSGGGEKRQLIARDQEGRIELVSFEPTGGGGGTSPQFTFPGPGGTSGQVVGPPLGSGTATQMRLTVRLFRNDPDPSCLDQDLAIDFEIVGHPAAGLIGEARPCH